MPDVSRIRLQRKRSESLECARNQFTIDKNQAIMPEIGFDQLYNCVWPLSARAQRGASMSDYSIFQRLSKFRHAVERRFGKSLLPKGAEKEITAQSRV